MGWLFQSEPIDRSFLERNVVPRGAKLVDYSKEDSRHWLLIEAVSKPDSSLSRDFITEDNGSVRFIALVLSRQDRSEPLYRYGYKAIDESMGPGAASCPLRLVRAASKPRNDRYGWRDRVLAHHEALRRSSHTRLVDGQIVQFDEPIEFAILKAGRTAC